MYLNEVSPAVDDRGHGDTLHMPIVITIHHLHKLISCRLQSKLPEAAIPSAEWMQLQFWPSNPYTDGRASLPISFPQI